MLNQVIVVGRIVRAPTLQVSENNKKYMNITLAVPRSFKNSEGVYETDYVDCILWEWLLLRLLIIVIKEMLLG